MAHETNNSLWRSSSREAFGSAPLPGDRTVELAIVGGGFTGCAAALEGARLGASVCLLEGEHVAHGGSGRNVGLVNAGLWTPPDEIIDRLGTAAGERLITELNVGPRHVRGLIEREGIDCEATGRGTLHCAHSADGLRDLENRHSQGRRYGAPLELLDAEETARRTGSSTYHGALLDPRAGTIQPWAYCHGLARAARNAGAMIHEQSPVSGIRYDGDRWVLTIGSHRVTAKALILATNAYHLGIQGLFAPEFVPVSYCQFATIPMPPDARARILPGGEGCWDTATVMSSFRTDAAGRMIVGGVGNSEGVGAPVHARWARRKLRTLFPEIAELPFEHAWRGRIAMTGDHLPKIVEFGPKGYAGFGYSGRGICPGTVFGTQIAKAIVTNDESHLPVPLVARHAERFSRARASYYEVGATLTHALSPTPLIN
ncbi:NAD(P)/FAD-dependent oxidoreductase [Sphingomonas sp. CFBP 13733]|uniref:NAD(P)/FAD-dependent oxidoreductase n=1 Tax=Sphingomonas sp. CFBP 13733 TaxID=2775291 RepID=UPI0017811D5B|nr:FAD-binding oxidoreductase [Sphingomonas sp. CFBP 13733]MBD8641574.1 FAD-binding oxidoreductase [Sphingomonas sp. CFBP 13733]